MADLAWLFLIFFGLIALRVPVAVSLALASFAGMLMIGIQPMNTVLQLWRGLDAFPILAVPFFLALGILANETSIGDRLLKFSAALVGRVRGSIGHINVVVSMFFAGISGAATADAAGIGSVMIPMMVKRGYPPAYAAAITGVSAVLGAIIPPSVLMIIYGAYTNVSIAGLFLAGVVPGILIGFAQMAVNYVYCRRTGVDLGRGAGFVADYAAAARAARLPLAATHAAPEQADTLGRTVREALPALFIPLFIILGVAGGAFTATEAGMAALVYVLVLAGIFYRELGARTIGRVATQSVRFYSIVLLAGGAATIFGWVMTLMGATDALQAAIDAVDLPPLGYLLVVMAVLLVVGTFLDPLPAIIIFAPVFLKGAAALGIDPVQLGIVVVMTMAFGMVTPPYGLVLLITAKLAGCSVAAVARAMVPFWIATVGVIALCAAVPGVALWLPRLVLPDLFPS